MPSAKSLAAANAAELCPLPASAHEPESAIACEHERLAHAEVAAVASAEILEAPALQPVSPSAAAAAQHEPGAARINGRVSGDAAGPRGSPREGRAAAAVPEAASVRPLQDLSASVRHQPGAAEIHGQTSREKTSPKGSHERRPAAGGMQLTPEQQKVAAAFLVVMKRAFMNGEDAANLMCNNSAVRSLVERLLRLSKENAVLSLASFGRDAPSEVLDSLTLLAKQCAAAGCQPLEVLTWSMQCDTQRKCISDEGTEHEHLLDIVADSLAAAQAKRIETGQPTGNITALVKLGVSQDVAALVACFLNTFRVLNKEDADTWRGQRSDLDHMLPGAIDVLASNAHADWTHGNVLRKLVPPIASALQAYKPRAVATGRSYNHIVMLQAAVQGWTHSPYVPRMYVESLLRYIIAAEPPAASVEPPPALESRPSPQPLEDEHSAPAEGSEGSAVASAPSMQAVRSQDAIEASAAGRNESHPAELPLPEAQPGISQPQPEPSGKSAAGAESSEHLGTERCAAASLKGSAALPESAPACSAADQAVLSDVAPPAAPPKPEPGGQDAKMRAPEDARCPSSSQHDDEAVASQRFTPEQRKVVGALLVVLKRAMRDGAEAMLSVKKTLVSNNNALVKLLMDLPGEGPLPSLRELEEGASSGVLESLSLLAKQCAAASCQPLEVFKWSTQCATNKAAHDSIASQGSMYLRLPHLGNSLMASVGSRTWSLEALVQLGCSLDLACVTAKVVNIVWILHSHSIHPRHRSDVDHMLPGVMDIMVDLASADWTCAETLCKLVPPIRASLQAYKDRAAATGQSFEHVIMLQAAVQGWTHVPLAVLRIHLYLLFKGMIKAEPQLASVDPPHASTDSLSSLALNHAASCAVEASSSSAEATAPATAADNSAGNAVRATAANHTELQGQTDPAQLATLQTQTENRQPSEQPSNSHEGPADIAPAAESSEQAAAPLEDIPAPPGLAPGSSYADERAQPQFSQAATHEHEHTGPDDSQKADEGAASHEGSQGEEGAAGSGHGQRAWTEPGSMPAAAGEPARTAGQSSRQTEAPVVPTEAERADRRRAKKQRQKAARAAHAAAQEPERTQAQVEGREAAGSLHAGHSKRSGMTKCVPLQPATIEPPSMEPAVSSHAEPLVAAAGPETPEQGPNLNAPASAKGMEALRKKGKGKKGKPGATAAVQEVSASAGTSAGSSSSSASAGSAEEGRPATEAQRPVQDAVGSRGFPSALRPANAGSAAPQSSQQADHAGVPDQAQGCRPQSDKAAQDPAPEEEPWLKVRPSRRKPNFPKPSPKEARMARGSGRQLPGRAAAAAQPVPQPQPSPPSPDEAHALGRHLAEWAAATQPAQLPASPRPAVRGEPPMHRPGQPAADSSTLWPQQQAAAATQFSPRRWPAASHVARQPLQQQQQQPEAVTPPWSAQPAAKTFSPASQAASYDFPTRRPLASHAAPQPLQPELVRPQHPAQHVNSDMGPQPKIATSAMVHAQQQGSREPAPPSPEALNTANASPKSSEEQAGTADAAPLSDWKEEPDDEECCVVCWVQLREVLFLSCGHMCACQNCATKIMQKAKECPMCRSTIETTIVVEF